MMRIGYIFVGLIFHFFRLLIEVSNFIIFLFFIDCPFLFSLLFFLFFLYNFIKLLAIEGLQCHFLSVVEMKARQTKNRQKGILVLNFFLVEGVLHSHF